jgi:nitrite reductase (NADH) small subunit
MSWVSLCEVGELQEGMGKYVEISGFKLAVFLDGGKFFAIDNECPHAGGSLADGMVDDGCVMCPWHAWSFHLENGEMRGAPRVKIGAYPVRVFEHNQKKLVQADLPIF